MEFHKLKVLIVDDDPQFLEIMKRSLENKNCFVKCTSDQKTALSSLINEVFHVIFIDCVLSSGQGTELISQIRDILGNSVNIIMMSGIVPEKSLSSYIDLGICDFLSKPISEKEIEENLTQIREKHIYGNKKNILVKLFSKNISDIQTLKFLISLEKAKNYEFFLYLNGALSSKESLSLQFQSNNKKHRIACNKGAIVNYECDKPEWFLNKLLSKKLVTNQDINQLRGQSQKECVNILLKNCILSSGQVLDIKYDMLIEALKEIVPGIEISLSINLTSPEKETFLLLNQSEYADLIFLFLKQKFNNQLFPLFDEEIMKKSLVFENNLPSYLPEVEGFLIDLKSKMKLKSAYNKYLNDKSSFCTYLLYILLKGNVYLSEASSNIKHYYLYERYQKLYQFINQTKKPEKLFLQFSSFPETYPITPNEIKDIYFRFVKNNHPDTMSFDIPKELLNLVNKSLSKVKNLYDACCDPNLKILKKKQKKKEILEKEIIWAEKKKICERHLEERKYDKAFSLIQSIPQKVVDEETDWQMLYLWLHFKSNGNYTNTNLTHKYMKNIQAKIRELQKDKLYHYILGLYHEDKQNYETARLSFERAKMLDPSFQPSYPAIKKSSLHLLEKKQKEQSFVFKFSFNKLRQKYKKTAS